MQNHFSRKAMETLKLSKKLSPYIKVSYNFGSKSFKNLNQIFWAMEYWFKVL